MSEVVWVALISAGSAVAVALMTQFLATRAADRQAGHQARQEEVRRQRSEAKAQQELHEARLRELWGHVLTARWQMLDTLERVPVKGRPSAESAAVSAAALPASAAGQAYAVALIGLAALRPGARAFYVATSDLQTALQAIDEDRIAKAVQTWGESFKTLEVQVAEFADRINLPVTRGVKIHDADPE